MIIVITANGADLDAPASPVFGRCPAYVFVDTESMQFEGVENPALGTASGAGIQAAQFVIERGAQAVVTGNVGPNAFNVFQSAGVPIYLSGGGTVREMAEALLLCGLAFLLVVPWGGWVVRELLQRGIGKQIRFDGPASHRMAPEQPCSEPGTGQIPGV